MAETFYSNIDQHSRNMISLSHLMFLLAFLVPTSFAVYCFECDSSQHFSCTEFWDPTIPVTEQYYTNCSHVYDAKYCVKMSGIFDGKLGTKRFCSSRDWGNYCEYIERPGDYQEYRSCVFTCPFHGCNNAYTTKTSLATSFLTLIASFLTKWIWF